MGTHYRRLKAQNIHVETLINNAGYGLQGRFPDHSLTDSLNIINLDIASLTAVTRLFADDMKKAGKGRILMVASLLSYQGVKNFAVSVFRNMRLRTDVMILNNEKTFLISLTSAARLTQTRIIYNLRGSMIALFSAFSDCRDANL